jgi:hypothetical protein
MFQKSTWVKQAYEHFKENRSRLAICQTKYPWSGHAVTASPGLSTACTSVLSYIMSYGLRFGNNAFMVCYLSGCGIAALGNKRIGSICGLQVVSSCDSVDIIIIDGVRLQNRLQKAGQY